MSNNWKQIPEFPDYEVNTNGIVRRLKDSKTSKSGKILKSTLNTFGYPSVMLRKDNKSFRRTVHNIVAQTFIGPRPSGYEINHINGNKEDSRLENLEYCTSSENKYHANKIGLGTRGTKNGMAILTEELVIKIKKEYVPYKVSQYALAKKYGISRGAVCDIIRGINWNWVKI